MTICVCALAEKTTLIAACDRMVTAGDVEFEPSQAKIWELSPAIYVLLAGDLTLQAEILKEVHKEVRQMIVENPNQWVSIKHCVELYCKEYRAVLRREAEREILSPLALDINSFLLKQGEMHVDMANDLKNRLIEYEFPSLLETIFVGHDTDGPVDVKTGVPLIYAQMYLTEGDKMSLRSTVGFAAIGGGKAHAESELMVSGHSPSDSFENTLLEVYSAKKRSEVAPGIGKQTDMLVLGPAIARVLKVEDRHIEEFERIYQRSRASNNRILENTRKRVTQSVERIRKEYKEKSAAETEKPSSEKPGTEEES